MKLLNTKFSPSSVSSSLLQILSIRMFPTTSYLGPTLNSYQHKKYSHMTNLKNIYNEPIHSLITETFSSTKLHNLWRTIHCKNRAIGVHTTISLQHPSIQMSRLQIITGSFASPTYNNAALHRYRSTFIFQKTVILKHIHPLYSLEINYHAKNTNAI
jgi:hypothetical protein